MTAGVAPRRTPSPLAGTVRAQISAVNQDGEVLEILPATIFMDPSSKKKMQSPPGVGQKVQWVVSSFPLDDDLAT